MKEVTVQQLRDWDRRGWVYYDGWDGEFHLYTVSVGGPDFRVKCSRLF